MRTKSVLLATLWGALVALAFFPSCQTLGSQAQHGSSATLPDGPIPLFPTERNHLATVMTSKFCGTCHPAIYAEHEQNTHGRAFTDPEPRLATGRFAHSDCIRCHTPRPVFETGNGMNPMRRYHNLEEGNTCMSCHWKKGQDYASFQGGIECKTAFDDRVGSVEACAACHRNHGTPYQWEKAPTGKAAGRTCMTCHMETVIRPVAVGEKPRRVKSHVFPGARSEKQLRRAYKYSTKIEGNEVVVTITNTGTGHNFPTELKQRSLESLVVVRDQNGKVQYRSRMRFRDPYKRPYGLMLPVNTQIPAGETRTHRVPLKMASGKVDCELHFKLYFPIEDHHPELARRLESQRLVFQGVTPSDKQVNTDPEPGVVLPENTSIQEASPANLVDFKRPPIGETKVTIPTGNSTADMERLVELFQFPVPEAQSRAVKQAATLGPAMVPYLIDTLGSWDNKTWKSGIKALVKMGAGARPGVIAALTDERLYVRIHARQIVREMDWVPSFGNIREPLLQGLQMSNALDRSTAAQTLGALRTEGVTGHLRKLLTDQDPDVVRAAALALAHLSDKDATAAITAALRRAPYIETRRDLARALASLGDPAGVPLLIEGLDHRDDLLRESFFETLFDVTGIHKGYDPLAPRLARLEAISRISAEWTRSGGANRLRTVLPPSRSVAASTWKMVQQLGGGAGVIPGPADGDEGRLIRKLMSAGESAVPALVKGLKYPSGFAAKRASICEALGRIGSKRAVPALLATLRDPVLFVADRACQALGNCNDAEALWGVQHYQDRLLTMIQQGKVKTGEGRPSVDLLLARAARTRLMLGDKMAKADLARALLADDIAARKLAIDALAKKFGDRRGYDPEASLAERAKAAAKWL